MVLYCSSELRTAYVINAFYGKFKALLERCKNEGHTLDIAECKFGPNCAKLMEDYYKDVNIINTEDEELNNILKHNMEQAKKVFEDFETLQLPPVPDMNDAVEMIEKLPENAKYCLQPNLGSQKQLALCTLLIMYRPDIEFDIRKCSVSLYEFVVKEWLLFSEPHDRYIEFTHGSYVIRDVVNGKLGSGKYGTGSLNYDDYIKNRPCLPYDFGTKCLAEWENDKPAGEWCRVMEKCIKILTYKKNMNKETLKDLLVFRRVV